MSKLPRICWTIAATTPEEALAQVRSVTPASSRFVELRLDYLAEPSAAPALIRSLKRSRISVLATLRSAAQGGRFQGSPEEQLNILTQAAKAGASIVDVEVNTAEQVGADALKPVAKGGSLLISFHDFQGTPDNPAAVLERLRAFTAAYYKIVPTSRNHGDNAAILGLYNQKRSSKKARTQASVIAFGMGEVGVPTRVLSLSRGAPFTYAAVCPQEAVAPGQLSGADLRDLYRADRVGPKTAFYGVIGNPIAHSISPAVHNAAFAAQRRDAVYMPLRVESFDDFLVALPAYGLSGFSVTMPHKEAAAAAVDWVEAVARDAGSVNTVVIRNGKLRGYNTDMPSVISPLEKRMKLRGARVLVAGTGGAARGAAFALARARANVAIVGRRADQAAALAEQVNGEFVERNALSDEQFDAIVHATPLGMTPDVDSCFFSPGDLNARVLFETVYTPAETKLMQMARRRGLQVISGLEMFLEQAALQYELWTGRKAPRAIMERAAKKALGEK